MLRASTDNVIDQQTRILTNRINQTEKYFERLGNGLGAYNRKIARARDKLDDLSSLFLLENSDSYSIDQGLSQFGHELTHLADLRDLEISTIDTQILSEINQYDEVCKSMRDEVKINASIRNKEVLRKRAAEQRRRDSTVLRADRDFEKIIEDFEEQKNKDLKEIMLNFVQIQLKIHLEGVNRLTGIYKQLKDIDCHADAVKFRDSILEGQSKESNAEAELKLAKSRSQSMGALNTLMHHPTNPFRKRSSKQEERINRSQDGLVESVPRVVTNETEDSDEDYEGSDTATEEDTETEQGPTNRLSVPKLMH